MCLVENSDGYPAVVLSRPAVLRQCCCEGGAICSDPILSAARRTPACSLVRAGSLAYAAGAAALVALLSNALRTFSAAHGPLCIIIPFRPKSFASVNNSHLLLSL